MNLAETLLAYQGKLTAITLLVLWAGTVLLVVDTRRNYTDRSTREVECPCRLQAQGNISSLAAPDRVGNASNAADDKPRTVTKWLRYCRHEKPGAPAEKDPVRPGKDGGQKVPQQQQQRPPAWKQKPDNPKKPAKKFINPHPYYFTMKNPDACKRFTNIHGYVDALCLVLTSPGDSYIRSLIRKTWASAKLVKGKRIVTMFLLGRRDTETQHFLELENNHYHDIIQENFHDSYYNLTLKTLMGLRWAAQFCPNARYILKVDVDMFVNVYNLVERLETAPTFNFAEGNRKDITEPIRDRHSKWYTSPEMYPGKTYPPYLDGPAYLVSGDLSSRVFGSSLNVRFLPWEDAYVGIIMHRIHVEPKYSGKYSSYLDYSNMQDTLRKISDSIAFHLGEDKEENKENILMVWNYVRKLNDVPVLD
ncbi:beta-1,3-galactosyltransferase 1-like [Acanthaster planci]|uniref:Hexosyltransferase n=1 Tax=Acanthaster planci TaxID=133434 RepID=A0A8B7Y3J5_ACAPL|nr:beta-1,3-galactosyltransferase 1-like [Acanthaster planci]